MADRAAGCMGAEWRAAAGLHGAEADGSPAGALGRRPPSTTPWPLGAGIIRLHACRARIDRRSVARIAVVRTDRRDRSRPMLRWYDRRTLPRGPAVCGLDRRTAARSGCGAIDRAGSVLTARCGAD